MNHELPHFPKFHPKMKTYLCGIYLCHCWLPGNPLVFPQIPTHPKVLSKYISKHRVTSLSTRRSTGSTGSTSLQQSRLNDPVALFNKDISRILSPPTHEYYHDPYENNTLTNIKTPFSPTLSKENKYNAACEAHSMLQQMMDLYQSGHNTVQPNRDTFLMVMKAYYDCSFYNDGFFTPISSTQMQKVLPSHKQNPRNTRNKQSKQSKQKEQEKLWEIEGHILQLHGQMKQLQDSTSTVTTSSSSPTTETYNLVLGILAKNGKRDELEEAVKEMEQHNIALDTESWHYVVQGWSFFVLNKPTYTLRDKDVDSYTQKMEKILDRMELFITNLSPDRTNSIHHSDPYHFLFQSYQTITNTFTRIHSSDATIQTNALQTESILTRMHSYSPLSVLFSHPVVVKNMYTSTILAWSHVTKIRNKNRFSDVTYNAARKASNTLHKFIALCKSQNQHLLQHSSSMEDEFFEEEEILSKMMEPPILAFNSVISAWAHCPHSRYSDTIEEAESVLTFINKLGNPKNLKWDKSTQEKEIFFNIQADVVTYNSLINAIGKSISTSNNDGGKNDHKKDTIHKISSLLDEMDNAKISPDAFTYSSAMDAYIRCGAPPKVTHSLLHQMEQRYIQEKEDRALRPYLYKHSAPIVAPNVRHYSVVLNAYAKSACPEEAQALLNHMEGLYRNTQDDNIRPDVISYTTVIEAWGKSFDPNRGEKALAILHKMIERYEDGSRNVNDNAFPTVRTFTAVILALANHRVEGNAYKAFHLLQTMNDMDITPNIYSYNYAINACANAPEIHGKEKEKLFKVVAIIFKRLQQRQKEHNDNLKLNLNQHYKEDQLPNSMTYSFFIKSCTHLLPSSRRRDDLVQKAFELSCKSGHVSKEVLYRLRLACKIEDYIDLLDISTDDGTEITVNDLPKEWSRNAFRKRKNRK